MVEHCKLIGDMTGTTPRPSPLINDEAASQASTARGELVKAIGAALGLVLIALVTAGCGGGLVNRMSVPQKVDVGTSAYCQSLSQASSIDPADSQLVALERYIVTPSSGHNGMGLPIQGTRLEADVQAARAANGHNEAQFLKAVKNVLSDCRYVLSRSH